MMTDFKRMSGSLWALLAKSKYHRFDLATALVLFNVTFLFSLTVGQNFYDKGTYGNWYQSWMAPLMVSKYNGHGLADMAVAPGSKLDAFLTEGVSGKRDARSIRDADAIPTSYGPGSQSLFVSYPAIIDWVAGWWHFIGYPSWQELYILLALFHGLTVVAAYFFLRQGGGLLPSSYLALVWGAMPASMYYSMMVFRDSSRAIFVFIILGLIGYFLQPKFTWRKIIVGAVVLGVTVGHGLGARTDFIFFTPFVFIAVFCFHGSPFFSSLNKKVVFTGLGLLIAVTLFYPHYQEEKNKKMKGQTEHVIYIGLAPILSDNLNTPSKNYSWCRFYYDYYGYYVGSSVGHHRLKFDKVEGFSREYQAALRNELSHIVYNFPYDLGIMAISGALNIFKSGFVLRGDSLRLTAETPAYSSISRFSEKLLMRIPRWAGAVAVGLFLFLIGLFNYSRFLLVLTLGFGCLGIYAAQFHQRHYYYLFIITLFAFCFIGSILLRMLVIFFRHPAKIGRKLKKQSKTILCRVLLMMGTIALALAMLQGLALWQDRMLKKQTLKLVNAPKLKLTPSAGDPDEQAGKAVTRLTFAELRPDLVKTKYPKTLLVYCEYLILEFDFTDSDTHDAKLMIHTRYQHPSNAVAIPEKLKQDRNLTKDSSDTLSFPIPLKGKYYFISPVYYSPAAYFSGLDIANDNLKYLKNASILAHPGDMFSNSTLWLPLDTSLDYKLLRDFEFSKILN